ncbi:MULTISPECIES: selenium metabolism membrane protein YedE/FdhT [Campylobacter]|uniref:selenium metabolism membrane protein YedE/FdhT n=1 Tax=Campylobacter TaxID=194 RepID=UPI00138DDC4F|nr:MULTISPECIES: selenium metabolism membrane protein YedE/FdhT [Campylobacter]MDV2490918.1 selenium metabolism membrane protein YedE/FdhT [Campylobacter sp. TJR-1]
MLNLLNSFKQKYIVNFWDVGKAMIALAILSAVYFGIFGGVWAVTGEMTRWGGEFLELFGMDLSSYSYYKMQNLNGTPLTRFEGIMLIGMFLGASIAAFMANKVKFRLPVSGIRVFQAIVGGLLSGFGARLAFGCNLANFFTGLPYFSLHTWLFAVFMVIGIYCAVQVGKFKIFRPKVVLERCGVNGKGIEHDKNRANRHFAYGVTILVFSIIWLVYLFINVPSFDLKVKASISPLALIFGIAFGFIISKGQICFTSCFRDLFLFGRDTAAKGAFFGMIIATLIVFVLMLNGYNSKIISFSPAVAIGAFLFGFGIVFAGGCECGWTYRATEGQMHFMIVGISNFVGTAILALNYDRFPDWFKDGPKINLLDAFGSLGGLALNLSLFVVALLLVVFYKKRFFAKGGY